MKKIILLKGRDVPSPVGSGTMLSIPIPRKIKQESDSDVVDSNPSSNLSVDDSLLHEINTNSVGSSNFDLLDPDIDHLSPQEVPGESGTIAYRTDTTPITNRKPGRPVKGSGRVGRGTKCLECGKGFNNSSALAKHKLTHSDERKYVCTICSKAFKRQDHLNGHMMTHRSKKPFQCQFNNCDKSYCDARSLRRHHENLHQEQLDLLNIYADDTKLQFLKQNVESQQSNCQTAKGQVLSQLLAASDLQAYSIDGLKPIKCEKCEKRFKNMAALNGHMRLHGGYVKKDEGNKDNEIATITTSSSSVVQSSNGPGLVALRNMMMNQDKDVKEEINKTPSLEDLNLSYQQQQLEALRQKKFPPNEIPPKLAHATIPEAAQITLFSQNNAITPAKLLESPQHHISNTMLSQYHIPYNGNVVLDYSNQQHFPSDSLHTTQQHAIDFSEHAHNQQPVDYVNHSNTFSSQHTPQSESEQVFQFSNIVPQGDQESYNPLSSPVSHATSSLPSTPCDVAGSIHISQPLTPNHVTIIQSPNHSSLSNISQDNLSNQNIIPIRPLATDHHSVATNSQLNEEDDLGLNGLSFHQAESMPNQMSNNPSISHDMTTNHSIESDNQIQSDQIMEIIPSDHPPSHPLTPHQPNQILQLASRTENLPVNSINVNGGNVSTSFSFPPLQNTEFVPMEYDDPSDISTPLTADDIIDAATAPLPQEHHSRSTGENSFNNIDLSDPPITLQPPPLPKRIRCGNAAKPIEHDQLQSDVSDCVKLSAESSITERCLNNMKDVRSHQSNGHKHFIYDSSKAAVSPSRDISKIKNNLADFNKIKVSETKALPSTFASSPKQQRKRKHRPDPIIIPSPSNVQSFFSQLRSPRLRDAIGVDKGAMVAPPYTPPPMLSPVRTGPGLFCSLTPILKPLTPKSAPYLSAMRFSVSMTEPIQEEEEEDDEITPEMAVQPHVNIGTNFQAEIPDLCQSKKSLFDQSEHGQLLWHPGTAQNLTDEDVQHYQDFACTAAIPGNGLNKEYALHLLHQMKGNITGAILQLMNDRPMFEAAHSLTRYKYQESSAWSSVEIAAYQKSLLKQDKDFFKISKDVGSKSVKECVQFYYLWKKVSCDDYKKLRSNRKKKETGSKLLPAEYKDSSARNTPSPCQSSVHSEDGDEVYPCRICDKVFSKVKSRNAHMKSHRPTVEVTPARSKWCDGQSSDDMLS